MKAKNLKLYNEIIEYFNDCQNVSETAKHFETTRAQVNKVRNYFQEKDTHKDTDTRKDTLTDTSNDDDIDVDAVTEEIDAEIAGRVDTDTLKDTHKDTLTESPKDPKIEIRGEEDPSRKLKDIIARPTEIVESFARLETEVHDLTFSLQTNQIKTIDMLQQVLSPQYNLEDSGLVNEFINFVGGVDIAKYPKLKSIKEQYTLHGKTTHLSDVIMALALFLKSKNKSEVIT